MNPKVDIQMDKTDRLIDLLGLIAIGILLIVPLVFIDQLPDQIPIHFNAKGIPDGYGGRASIFILPAIGIPLFFGLRYMRKFPHISNYPVRITKENAERQYHNNTKLLLCLNLSLALIFLYLIGIQIASVLIEGTIGFGIFTVPLILIVLFAPIIYFYQKAKKLN